jgi:hypothetical protein
LGSPPRHPRRAPAVPLPPGSSSTSRRLSSPRLAAAICRASLAGHPLHRPRRERRSCHQSLAPSAAPRAPPTPSAGCATANWELLRVAALVSTAPRRRLRRPTGPTYTRPLRPTAGRPTQPAASRWEGRLSQPAQLPSRPPAKPAKFNFYLIKIASNSNIRKTFISALKIVKSIFFRNPVS